MAKNSNGMGSVTYTMRDGKKYWTGRVSVGFDVNGELVRRSFSGFKKADVIEKMQAAINDVNNNISGIVDPGDARLINSMEYWLYSVKVREVKAASLVRYGQLLRLHIEPFPFSKLKVKDVTILNLQNFINNMSDREGVSLNLIRDTLSLIKSFLDYTVVMGMLPSNPAKYVKAPKMGAPIKTNAKNNVYRIFSAAEQQLLLQEFDLEDPVEQMLFIDFFTGLRRGELRGLKWKHYYNGTFYINEQLNRTYDIEDGMAKITGEDLQDVKTLNSNRELPLPQIADNLVRKLKVACIEKHLKLGIPFSSESYIFSDHMCRPIEEKRPNRRLQAICRRLGIEERPLHSVRHSYATRLFEQGVDIKTVQHLMGHSDFKTTLNIYTHVMPEVKESAVSALDKMFGSGI